MIKDQLNREIEIKQTPKRIVSLVPSQTELLVELGLESSIIGVTKFCVHPEHLRKSKTVVGGTKQINFGKIEALKPDVILCNKEENTKEMISDLQAIAQVHVSDIYNLQDCYQLISMYGKLFQVEQGASDVIFKIKTERERFQELIQTFPQQKVAYFIWKNPWMVAASDTFIDFMLGEAGFNNVFKNEQRYPEIELSNSNLNEADAIFLSSEPFPFKNKHIIELQTWFPHKTIKIVNGEMFSWYGSRLQQAFKYFESLHDKK